MTAISSVPAADSGKTPQQLYAERAKRLADAAQLKQPDRIPIQLRFGDLLPDLEGVTRQAMYENPELAQAALEKAMLRFQPDSGGGMWHTPGPSRVLGDRSTKWPGYGLEPNVSFQYHEHEFMQAEDYDAFLADPADWAIRVYLPRVFSELQGLSLLPPLSISLLGYYAMMQFVNILALPPVASAWEALAKAAQLQSKWIEQQVASANRLAALGFPPNQFLTGSILAAPFDFMSDTMRGMRGIFLDLRRCPDKLLAAEEKVIAFQIEAAIGVYRARGIPYAFLPLHRGSDGFIALPVFERFYWPQLKRVLLELIDAGITPCVFWEGTWDQRLKYLAELPKGKTIGIFQSSNLFKVKEVLGDTMCIVGGMPVSMLVGGTADQIRAHTKKLCQVVGQGGGFIMSTNIGELEGCDPELIQVWVDATREYGAY